jgi:hypothetical protein
MHSMIGGQEIEARGRIYIELVNGAFVAALTRPA